MNTAPPPRPFYAFGRQYRPNGNLNRMRALGEGTADQMRVAARTYLTEARDQFNEGMFRVVWIYSEDRTSMERWLLSKEGHVVQDHRPLEARA